MRVRFVFCVKFLSTLRMCTDKIWRECLLRFPQLKRILNTNKKITNSKSYLLRSLQNTEYNLSIAQRPHADVQNATKPKLSAGINVL